MSALRVQTIEIKSDVMIHRTVREARSPGDPESLARALRRDVR